MKPDHVNLSRVVPVLTYWILDKCQNCLLTSSLWREEIAAILWYFLHTLKMGGFGPKGWLLRVDIDIFDLICRLILEYQQIP